MIDKVNDSQVMKVWQWCSDTYLQYGIKISFPANTEPKKTYQWRYASGIAAKFADWELDEQTAKTFIKVAVFQAKQKGILKKGLAALHQHNILDICYRVVTRQSKERANDIDLLKSIKLWYDNKIGKEPAIKILLDRKSSKALTNITQWYQSHSLSDLFISLSKDCLKAVSRLQDAVDSELLPKQTTLYLLRQEFLSDVRNRRQAIEIFGSDWRD